MDAGVTKIYVASPRRCDPGDEGRASAQSRLTAATHAFAPLPSPLARSAPRGSLSLLGEADRVPMWIGSGSRVNEERPS